MIVVLLSASKFKDGESGNPYSVLTRLEYLNEESKQVDAYQGESMVIHILTIAGISMVIIS